MCDLLLVYPHTYGKVKKKGNRKTGKVWMKGVAQKREKFMLAYHTFEVPILWCNKTAFFRRKSIELGMRRLWCANDIR